MEKDIVFKEIDLTRTSLDEDKFQELCSELDAVQDLNDKVNELLGIKEIEEITKEIEENAEIIFDEIDEIKITSYKPILIGSTIGAITVGPIGFLMGLKYGIAIVALSGALGGGLSGGLLGKYFTS